MKNQKHTRHHHSTSLRSVLLELAGLALGVLTLAGFIYIVDALVAGV